MVVFVILHYKNLNDTLECILSIKKNAGDGYEIVVVDNGTLSDESYQTLLKETKHVIRNQDNLGFAVGNNIGCQYAIKNFHPDFLVVLNNDIVLLESNFIFEIQQCYLKTKFDFMGPRILTNGGDSVNPFPAYETLEQVRGAIQKSERLLKIYQNVFLSFLLSCYLKVKHFIKKPVHLKNGSDSCYDVALHGCFLVFSKKYYKKYSDVFYPETFLYHEEEFLHYRKLQDQLISYYDSSISVFHKEGASLNLAFRDSNRKKLIFRNQEILKSLHLLEDLMMNKNKIEGGKV